MIVGKLKYVMGLTKNYSNWVDIIISRIFNRPIRKVVLKNGITIVGGELSTVIDIVDEVFIRKVYTPSYLSIKPSDTVVDIGANIGIFSLYSALQGANRIFSIEPLKGNLRFITNNFTSNSLTPPFLINVAITKDNGTSKLYLPGQDSHGMLFDYINGHKITKFQTVRGIKFGDLLKRYNLRKIDFLKIDCEGGEGFIFSNSNKNDWNGVKKISIEYHDSVSILNHNKIIRKLSQYGFKTRLMKSDETYGYIYAWK